MVDWILAGLVVGVVFGILWRQRRRRKAGKPSCSGCAAAKDGCSGSSC